MRMKNLKIIITFIVLATIFGSCKDENQEMSKKSVTSFQRYVDSVSNVAQTEVTKNWDSIETNYKKMKINVENSIANATEKESLQKEMDNTSAKYENFKMKIIAEIEKMNIENEKMMMYKSLFGQSYIGDNMKFNWVNKDNILSVYENFYKTIEANKDSYYREDWDEIKIAYEALDTRKNTVEKEGLSTKDNLKIAGIKMKFAPMYTLNRMGTKSEENSEAKK